MSDHGRGLAQRVTALERRASDGDQRTRDSVTEHARYMRWLVERLRALEAAHHIEATQPEWLNPEFANGGKE